MSTLSMKKISAAAVAAVLSVAGVSHAAQITLPYTTNFTTTPDSNGDTYTATSLDGAGIGQNNWVDETNEPTGVAAVNAGGGVTLSASPQTGALAGAFSDVYNSNLAGHAAGNGIVTPLTPPASNQLVIGYNMLVNTPTGSQTKDSATNPFSAAGFGMEVLGADDKIIANLFDVAEPSTGPGATPPHSTTPEEDIEVNRGATGDTTLSNTDPIGIGPANGIKDSYSISLNFTAQTFQVFVNGVTDGVNYHFANTESQVGGITFSTDNGGTDTAVFSNLSVVPEPASMALIGLGGLLLVGRRPKRLA
jgi:hypothetical protein